MRRSRLAQRSSVKVTAEWSATSDCSWMRNARSWRGSASAYFCCRRRAVPSPSSTRARRASVGGKAAASSSAAASSASARASSPSLSAFSPSCGTRSACCPRRRCAGAPSRARHSRSSSPPKLPSMNCRWLVFCPGFRLFTAPTRCAVSRQRASGRRPRPRSS